MGRFIEGCGRHQELLLSDCVDDYVSAEDPVQVIDVSVDELDLAALGFQGAAATGRPGYRPETLLKLYLYGFINQVQSSRRLKRDAMRIRRWAIEDVFGTIKDWMGWSHFKTRRLGKVSTGMDLHVFAYDIKRAIALLGSTKLITAMQGWADAPLAHVDALQLEAVSTQPPTEAEALGRRGCAAGSGSTSAGSNAERSINRGGRGRRSRAAHLDPLASLSLIDIASGGGAAVATIAPRSRDASVAATASDDDKTLAAPVFSGLPSTGPRPTPLPFAVGLWAILAAIFVRLSWHRKIPSLSGSTVDMSRTRRNGSSGQIVHITA